VSSADTSRDDEERPTARRDRRWLVTLIALTVVTLALLAGTTWLFFANRAADDMETDRGNVALAARQAVISLTSLSHQNAEQTYTRLLQGTTGDYRNQLSQQAGPFKDALTQGQVESSGQVLEAGVDKLDGATATALVVATANVKNTQAPQGENRQYRLHLTLQRQDGQWLVSNLEFVA
jgi:Mce-associated membrane protein